MIVVERTNKRGQAICMCQKKYMPLEVNSKVTLIKSKDSMKEDL